MPPGEYGVAANAKTLAASDLVVDSAAFLPVGLSAANPEHDRSDKCICAVRRLDAADSQVSFAFKPFA
jgi:hypothetical protein